VDVEALKSELQFKAVRSSGNGGQHVNKVASKVVLYFNLEASLVFNTVEKQRLKLFFNTRLSKQDILILSSSESRSQLRNKNLVTQRFLQLIEEGLKEVKDRKPTKISKAIKQKRLETKRKNSEKKANRKPPKVD
jgi:ribosome-associated protein